MYFVSNAKITTADKCFICEMLWDFSKALLCKENMVLVIGETPWFAHAASLGHPDLDGQPVYTVLYAEWLINAIWQRCKVMFVVCNDVADVKI